MRAVHLNHQLHISKNKFQVFTLLLDQLSIQSLKRAGMDLELLTRLEWFN